MSSRGDAVSAAPAAHSDVSHDLLGLGDTTSSQDVGPVKQSEAQIHNRSVSGSGSIYFDATDSGEPSFVASDDAETRGQPDSGAEEGRAKLKGKEISRTDLEEPQAAVCAGDPSVSQSSGDAPVEEVVHRRIPPVVTQLTRDGSPKRSVPAGEFHPSYRVPDIQGSSNPSDDSSGRDSTSSAFTRMPPSSLPSFGGQGNTEEDRRNWDRIQSIAGPSANRQNYIPGGPAALSDSAAQSPSRLAQKRKSSSSDNARGLDGTGSGASAANTGHLRPPPYESYSSGGASISRDSLTSRRDDQQSSREVVVPRWQPDAEVTFCPICATQFSECSTETCQCFVILTVE